jgi:hypothetical protein
MTAPTDDIAMLKLDLPVNQQPIQLAGRAAQTGDRTMLYGWGVDQPDCSSDLPTRLQQLSTHVLPAAKCADADQSTGEICTSNPHGTDGPGPGDSGGPAVELVNGVPKLVGTCSRAATEYPGEGPTVYTSFAGLPAVAVRRRAGSFGRVGRLRSRRASFLGCRSPAASLTSRHPPRHPREQKSGRSKGISNP